MKITACLITKNEEKNIELCINSFKDIVNELILVDTGSTDNTVQIAKKLGASIFNYNWDNNFSNARNYALEKATGDWVLFLDADEYFINGTEKNLINVLKEVQKDKSVNALLLRRYNIDFTDGKLKNTDYMPRIFRNNTSIRYVGNVHENVSIDGKLVGTKVISEEKLAINHTGYSINIIKNKLKRNLELLLDNVSTNTSDHIIYILLSDCYKGLEDYENAIKYSKLFLLSEEEVFGYNVVPYLNIISSMIVLGKEIPNIKTEINMALTKFPDHPEFHRLLGFVNYMDGNFTSSLSAFETSIDFHYKYKSVEPNNMPSYLYEVYYYMAKIFIEKKDNLRALDCLIKSLKEQPRNKLAFKELLYVIKEENPQDIVLFLKTIYDDSNEKDVEFLVRIMSDYKYGQVLLYYNNKWMNDFNRQDSSFMFTLLSNKRYAKAYKLFKQCYFEEYSDWTAKFLVVSAILNEDLSNIEYIKQHVHPSLKRIIESFYSLSSQPLLQTDLGTYLEILKELILLGDLQMVGKFINIKVLFMEDISDYIADLLFENRHFQLSEQQYKEALKLIEFREEKGNVEFRKKGIYFYKIGICLYMIGEYSKSTSYFCKAISYGYVENDIYEYLNFTLALCNEEETRKKIKNLLKRKE